MKASDARLEAKLKAIKFTLQDLAQSKGMVLKYTDLNKLATILVRHTIGFGLLEVLLQDKKLQEILIFDDNRVIFWEVEIK